MHSGYVFSISKYHSTRSCRVLLNIIMLMPVSLCVISMTPLNPSASLRISYWPSFEHIQLLLSPGAAYLSFWHHSLSTLFSYPMLRFRASSAPKKTAHSRSLRHVIVSLDQYFGQPFLFRACHDCVTSPSAVARTSTSIFPEWLYPLQ